jgi:hypothetical protein
VPPRAPQRALVPMGHEFNHRAMWLSYYTWRSGPPSMWKIGKDSITKDTVDRTIRNTTRFEMHLASKHDSESFKTSCHLARVLRFP